MRNNRRTPRRGVALVAAVVFAFLVLALGVGLLRFTTSELISTRSQTNVLVARNVAEAGAEVALSQWNDGTKPATLSGNVTGSVKGVSTLMGTYTVTCEEDEDHTLTITSVGLEANAPAGVNGETVRLTATGLAGEVGARPFAYAGFGDEGIDLSGSGSSDSYDSALGPYQSGSAKSNGGMGTNSPVVNAIKASGNPIIKGKVVGGVGADPNALKNGWRTFWAYPTGGFDALQKPMELPPVEQPASGTPFGVVSVVKDSNLKISGPNGGTSLISARTYDKYKNNFTWNIPSGVYTLDKINMGSDQNVVNINGDVTLICNNTTQSMLTGGNTAFNIYGTLKIYVNGNVDIGASFTTINPTNPYQPSKVQILGTPTCKTITWSGHNNFVGCIYAPAATVNLTASSNLYGAVVGKKIVMSGAGIIHYDEQLENLTMGSGSGEVSQWVFQTWERY